MATARGSRSPSERKPATRSTCDPPAFGRWDLAATAQLGRIADAFPIAGERFACPFATVDRKPIGKDRRIHCSGAGRTEPLEGKVFLVQESVEHTPGKGTMSSASLEGQVDGPDLAGRFVTGSPSCLRPLRRVSPRSNFHSRIPPPFAFARSEATTQSSPLALLWIAFISRQLCQTKRWCWRVRDIR